jgi:hypothetical protein
MPYLAENGPLPRTIPETEIKAACESSLYLARGATDRSNASHLA